MVNVFLIFFCKSVSFISRILNLGHGSTWPGHIALSINPHFIKDILKTNDKRLKTILVAGTNGKTTTGRLIQTILEQSKYKVFQNEAGANLLNGIASSLLLHSNVICKINYDCAIFEIDEATLPLILKEISPDYLVLLNLFRDQLDRYGEVNTIAKKWAEAIRLLSSKTKLILNADDPQIYYLAKSRDVVAGSHPMWNRIDTSVFYFGLDDKTLHRVSPQHAVDSTYCPNCDSKLYYNSIYYSHLGDWECKKCKLKRPSLDISSLEYYPISGTYNRYNTLAAVLLAKQVGIEQNNIESALHEFTPAFGRQETIDVNGKRVQIFLSKNPTSFNESLRTIADLKAPARNATQSVAGGKNVLFVLNDRIPDGQDVSWIWDVDFEEYVDDFENIIISGDRVYDMGLRIKYAQPIIHPSADGLFIIQENLREAIALSLKKTPKTETLYVLPTYSAMLEVRQTLTGKKIL